MQTQETIDISVIVPSYNGMPLFKASLDSVLAQKGVSYEVLVGNDSPSDVETRNYLDQLHYEKLRVFHNENNLGLFGNLNNLIRNSNGRIIHLWSQDDIMNTNCLYETVNFHNENPNIAYAFSRVEIIDESGTVIDRMSIDSNSTMSSQTHDLTSILTGSVPGNIANVSINKSIFETYGYFREDLKYSGDFEFWCRITDRLPVGIIQKHLIKLRRHTGQLSRNPKMWIHRIEENDEILTTFMARVPEDRKKYLKRGLLWRVYNQYFGLYLNLLRTGDNKEAQEFLKVLKKYSSVPNYYFRYSILKSLSVIKKDKKFQHWLYYKQAFGNNGK
ncbi:glycosyltransferase (GT2) [Formosa agariphila KMM 3901]|uniref:Glycosyltransferase (GT2) n=1 Tax=Formosa agariphila (strain DSM 15362 / KCTC 12365 / LMG 23005 / KMM 3901 / M-2Alg 35-1) TaxID=1347342 RepID=T2KP43_FORAG|nr:glycosyltransferase family 2 protein [Formosa agariphila]CDF80627.1 glycosyltransferase (GT2) [Formosa agariphila KMM 3901]